MTALGLQERYALIDACTSYDELLALAASWAGRPCPHAASPP